MHGTREDQPTGVLTFAFSDIVDAAALWEESPAEMKAALAEHDEIIDAVLDAYGGDVFSHAGVRLGMAFHSASDAVNSAVALKRATKKLGEEHALPFRVRIGLDAGTADERNGRYHGLPVARARRIMSLGRLGGSVLCSPDVIFGCAASSTARIDFASCGRVRLEGFPEPVEVFRVRHIDERRAVIRALRRSAEPGEPRSVTLRGFAG